MSLLLPDINVWLAYTVAEHPHHKLVRERWKELEGDLAFCRVSQMGYLRLLTNPAAMGPSALTARQAWDLYDRLAREQLVRFLPEPPQTEAIFRRHAASVNSSHKLWTDAYLAAFAMAGKLTVLTLDQGFRSFAGIQVVIWQEKGTKRSN